MMLWKVLIGLGYNASKNKKIKKWNDIFNFQNSLQFEALEMGNAENSDLQDITNSQ